MADKPSALAYPMSIKLYLRQRMNGMMLDTCTVAYYVLATLRNIIINDSVIIGFRRNKASYLGRTGMPPLPHCAQGTLGTRLPGPPSCPLKSEVESAAL